MLVGRWDFTDMPVEGVCVVASQRFRMSSCRIVILMLVFWKCFFKFLMHYILYSGLANFCQDKPL